MKKTHISSTQTHRGFITHIDKRSIATTYPRNVWSAVPKQMKQVLGETAAYFFTHFMAVSRSSRLMYDFPPPPGKLFVDYGFFYSMADAHVEFPEKKLSVEHILKDVYNAEFYRQFTGIPGPLPHTKGQTLRKNSALMPMSFGKDSLTTFALLTELGFRVHPVFFEEPTAPYHNVKKRTLADGLQKEFGVPVTRFPNALGGLRQSGGMMWGWDMLLTQYTTLLLPFVYHHAPQYFFWSNEQSTNESEVEKSGYIINSTHEQGVQWTLHLSNLYRTFGINTTIGSLLEPLHELLILWILHKRYPHIAKYQLSCDGEKTAHRWCGRCTECARVFVFLTAIGVDPKTVGLMDNMLLPSKRKFFYLFDPPKHQNLDTLFQSYPERLLAFYLSYKRGMRGGLMDEFEKKLLPTFLKQKKQLLNKYLTVHESYTIPKELKPKLYSIYRKELRRFKKELT